MSSAYKETNLNESVTSLVQIGRSYIESFWLIVRKP